MRSFRSSRGQSRCSRAHTTSAYSLTSGRSRNCSWTASDAAAGNRPWLSRSRLDELLVTRQEKERAAESVEAELEALVRLLEPGLSVKDRQVRRHDARFG